MFEKEIKVGRPLQRIKGLQYYSCLAVSLTTETFLRRAKGAAAGLSGAGQRCLVESTVLYLSTNRILDQARGTSDELIQFPLLCLFHEF